MSGRFWRRDAVLINGGVTTAEHRRRRAIRTGRGASDAARCSQPLAAKLHDLWKVQRRKFSDNPAE
ncbi:hypothetical protein ACNUDN_05130 [Mycobacterium sp. smrl_JER01]